MFYRRNFQSTLTLVFVLFTLLLTLLYNILVQAAIHETEDHVVNNQLNRQYEKLNKAYQSATQEKARDLTADEFILWAKQVEVLMSDGISLHHNYSNTLPKLPLQQSMDHIVLDNHPDADRHRVLIRKMLELYEMGHAHDNSHAHSPIPTDMPAGLSEFPDADIHLLNHSLGKHAIVLFYDISVISNLDKVEEFIDTALSIMSLFVIGISVVISYIAAKLIARPLTHLTQQVALEPAPKHFKEEERPDEIGKLARAFSALVNRLHTFLQREAQFTRHASHELRTPLALIKNSLSVLKLKDISEEKQQRNLANIENATNEMSELIDVFLVLGRENDKQPEAVAIELMLMASLEKFEPLTVKPNLHIAEEVTLQTDKKLLAILLDNIVKNANLYCQSYIHIQLDRHSLSVSNDKSDIMTSIEGYGFGLEIIQRIAARLDWQIAINEDAQTFNISIQFP